MLLMGMDLLYMDIKPREGKLLLVMPMPLGLVLGHQGIDIQLDHRLDLDL